MWCIVSFTKVNEECNNDEDEDKGKSEEDMEEDAILLVGSVKLARGRFLPSSCAAMCTSLSCKNAIGSSMLSMAALYACDCCSSP